MDEEKLKNILKLLNANLDSVQHSIDFWRLRKAENRSNTDNETFLRESLAEFGAFKIVLNWLTDEEFYKSAMFNWFGEE